jgi:hypothetical protein
MTPEQALAILVSASEVAALPKAAHLQVEQAAKIIADTIKPKVEKEQA